MSHLYKRTSIKLIALLLVSSCVTMNMVDKADGVLSFRGKVTYEIKGQKNQYLVDIFIHEKDSALRFDIVSPLSFVYVSIVQKEQDLYWVLLPLNRAYYITHKEELSQWSVGWILEDSSWLRQALLRQSLQGWNCQPSNKKPTRCTKKDASVEWRSPFSSTVHANFKVEKPYKIQISTRIKRQKIDNSMTANRVFYNQIPSNYKKLKKLPELDVKGLK